MNELLLTFTRRASEQRLNGYGAGGLKNLLRNNVSGSPGLKMLPSRSHLVIGRRNYFYGFLLDINKIKFVVSMLMLQQGRQKSHLLMWINSGDVNLFN